MFLKKALPKRRASELPEQAPVYYATLPHLGQHALNLNRALAVGLSHAMHPPHLLQYIKGKRTAGRAAA
jgi:hypothetical protein